LLLQPMDVKHMLDNMILDGPFQNPSKIFNLQLDDVALLWVVSEIEECSPELLYLSPTPNQTVYDLVRRVCRPVWVHLLDSSRVGVLPLVILQIHGSQVPEKPLETGHIALGERPSKRNNPISAQCHQQQPGKGLNEGT